MTTSNDDNPRLDLLDVIDWQTQKNLAEIAKNSAATARALANAAEKIADVGKTLNRIDDTLARIADASEAFVSLFGAALGSAQTESGEPTAFLQIAGPLGVRGNAR